MEESHSKGTITEKRKDKKKRKDKRKDKMRFLMLFLLAFLTLVSLSLADPCNPNPCQNGGTCANGCFGHSCPLTPSVCICPTGWSGTLCQTRKNSLLLSFPLLSFPFFSFPFLFFPFLSFPFLFPHKAKTKTKIKNQQIAVCVGGQLTGSQTGIGYFASFFNNYAWGTFPLDSQATATEVISTVWSGVNDYNPPMKSINVQ